MLRHLDTGGLATEADLVYFLETGEPVPEIEAGETHLTPQKDISERVRAAIRAWLDGGSRRRLLILLDECDQFFEADAPRFDQTKKLKGLGSDTKGRAKVVFAGLHSVQQFSEPASNGPFGHLAQTPKVIGPLAPQFAADLLVEPMRALGFEFADVDLVNRVLGYCSYQPFLLEMFGHKLVKVMVVISDFASYQAKPETCREAVDLAETLLPHTPGVTRAVVIVTDPGHLDLWRTLLTGAEPTSAAPVALRRHDHRGLRGWAQRVEMFRTDDRLERLHALMRETGGRVVVGGRR